MINALFGLAYLTHFIKVILFDFTWLKIYFSIVVVYLVFVLVTRNMKENPKRKTLMIATWNGKKFYQYL